MPLVLRPATPADQAAIEHLIFTILREYGLAPDPEGVDADLRDLDGAYGQRGGRFDVLVDEHGAVLGTVGLCPIDATTVELRKMYLARSRRGQGHGRYLLEHALARAVELGFSRVVLETATVLREAIALYERYGFRRYPADHLVPRCDRAYILDLDRNLSDAAETL